MLTQKDRLALFLFILARDKAPFGDIEDIIYDGLRGEGGKLNFQAESMPNPDEAATPVMAWAQSAAERILGPKFASTDQVTEVVNGLLDRESSPIPMRWDGPYEYVVSQVHGGTSDGRSTFRERVRNFIRRSL